MTSPKRWPSRKAKSLNDFDAGAAHACGVEEGEIGALAYGRASVRAELIRLLARGCSRRRGDVVRITKTNEELMLARHAPAVLRKVR